jgi:hypothetical protein
VETTGSQVTPLHSKTHYRRPYLSYSHAHTESTQRRVRGAQLVHHPLSLAFQLVMAGYSRVKAPRTRPHDNNDDLSSLYSRPSIQNSSHWPSVNLHSPGPSVRTLNQSDGGTYRDDISSLANFASEDIDPSVRDSVLTANMSASPSSNRPSTPSGSFRGKYQHLPVSLETSGESRRSYSSVSSLVDNVIKDLPRQSALTDTALVPPLQSTPNGEHSSESHQLVTSSTTDTTM